MNGEIDWRDVKRVLIVKLRSIGDTVLATPSLIALKRYAPHVEVDILLEGPVAPVLDGFEYVDNVITVGKGVGERARTAWHLGRSGYDIAFNLHGGTTAAFFTAASLARYRVGIATYQYPFLHNKLLSSSSDFWGRRVTHSAEQQLAVLGFVGVPVADKPLSHIAVTKGASASLGRKLAQLSFDPDEPFAVVHPLAAFDSKRWPIERFARTISFLAGKGLKSIAVGSQREAAELEALQSLCSVRFWASGDINLPETSALLSRAALFVGNDSGIAHMAAAAKVPSVVIFGSSNRGHWSPWTDSPSEMVFNEFPCQPCAGYTCAEFGEPRCVLSVTSDSVSAAIERILEKVAG